MQRLLPMLPSSLLLVLPLQLWPSTRIRWWMANSQSSIMQLCSVLNFHYEYAQSSRQGINCVTDQTSCDWFADNLDMLSASTTATATLQPQRVYAWTFASTTPGALKVPATNNRATKAINVPTPTRYVRVVFYAPAGSTPLGVWANFVARKEVY